MDRMVEDGLSKKQARPRSQCLVGQSLANFPVKDQIVNSLGFAGYMVSMPTIQSFY